jgi:AcrR family transcriptional regulator
MQTRSEETHSNLVLAAQRLFSQNGYDATGVAEICQAAGVSKGAFYHHFPTKQALFLRLLTNWLAELDAAMQAYCQSAQPVPDILLDLTRVLPGILQAADGRLPMFLEFWQQASRDPVVGRATLAPYRHYRQFFAQLVERGIQEGSFKPMHSDAAAEVILSLAVGLLLQALLDPQGPDWPALARQSLGMVLDGWRLS